MINMRFTKILLLTALLLVAFGLTSGMSISLGSQQEIDLEKGLVAYWKFDEGQGDIAFDETENHNDGELLCHGEGCSPPEWVKGRVGYAFHFDGVDDYINAGNKSSLNITGAITVVLWAKPQPMLGNGDLITKAGAYILEWDTALESITGQGFQLYLEIATGGNFRELQRNIAFGQWIHIVFTYDAAQKKTRCYLNGEFVNDYSDSGNIATSENNLLIGSYFNGFIDEVYIYNRALTEDEIRAIYEQGQEGSITGS